VLHVSDALIILRIRKSNPSLGAFGWVARKALLASSKLQVCCTSVRPSVLPSVRMYQFGSHWINFPEIWCVWKYIGEIEIWLKLNKIIGHFTRSPGCVYFFRATCFFLRRESLMWAKGSLSGLRYHTQTHQTRWNFSGRVISPLQRPLPDNTLHSQETDIHAPGGIRTCNSSKRATVGPRLSTATGIGCRRHYIAVKELCSSETLSCS
jgi:hypothetical protein